jgi:hypothetical protein
MRAIFLVVIGFAGAALAQSYQPGTGGYAMQQDLPYHYGRYSCGSREVTIDRSWKISEIIYDGAHGWVEKPFPGGPYFFGFPANRGGSGHVLVTYRNQEQKDLGGGIYGPAAVEDSRDDCQKR